MPLGLGLDFGTTNTVIALPAAGGGATPIVFHHDNEAISAFRSVLCFWKDETKPSHPITAEAGPWAIEHFLENAGTCRFLQSLKTYAASPLFQETRIYGRKFIFEDLLRTFLNLVRLHAGLQIQELPRRFIVGRPVRFAGSNPNAQLAMARYARALDRFGVEDVRFVHEPVAAAFFFAQRLAGNAIVLVADFGGGTSDFSIVRFEAAGGAMRTKALASSGVAVAGDTFDYHIIDKLISPKLGKGTRYQSMGKALDLPNHFFSSFAHWNELSVMKTSRDFRDLKQLQRQSLEPQRLQTFIDIVELDLGYSLYRSVSEAKAQLSVKEQTDFEFAADGVVLRDTICRADFETWIADDLDRISSAVDDAMRQAGLKPAGIDKVFLTGGTSFVPAVRRMFENRFGAAKIEGGDELTSIAHGLALIGEREDIDQWCVAADG
jgi:hypothetical chaperone protein